jgi:hypothetical protein
MATTTPNYGWAVPTSTDLVKDGATAIETLGDAIDASMNTALGTKKAGMVLLNTTSFSGVSSQSVNDVFSATYKNYRIIINVLGSGSGGGGFGTNLRLRVSGTDNSSSNYRYAGYGLGDASASSIFKVQSNGTTTSFLLEAASSQAYSYKVIDVFMPFETQNTSIQYQGMYLENTPQFFGYDMGGVMSVTTSYTGFTFLPAAGNTLTGTIYVYGYNA